MTTCADETVSDSELWVVFFNSTSIIDVFSSTLGRGEGEGGGGCLYWSSTTEHSDWWDSEYEQLEDKNGELHRPLSERGTPYRRRWLRPAWKKAKKENKRVHVTEKKKVVSALKVKCHHDEAWSNSPWPDSKSKVPPPLAISVYHSKETKRPLEKTTNLSLQKHPSREKPTNINRKKKGSRSWSSSKLSANSLHSNLWVSVIVSDTDVSATRLWPHHLRLNVPENDFRGRGRPKHIFAELCLNLSQQADRNLTCRFWHSFVSQTAFPTCSFKEKL